MARRRSWIAMALAIPATVAFTPASPPGPLPGPPPADPQVVVPAKPVAAMTPALPASPALPALPASPALPAPATPPGLPVSHVSPPAPERDVGPIVVAAALTRVGAPYAWAGTGPDAFDCSGLVVWAFKQAGVTLPRSSGALAAGGQPVPWDQMQPGDVISYFPDASHVGIYVGGGRMVHAVSEGLPVAVDWLRHAPIHNVRRYR